MGDTKITRLRNLLTPVKNYIAMVNADKRGESISTLLLDRELETINKYSDEIWEIIAEIPNNACDGECTNENSGLHLQRVSGSATESVFDDKIDEWHEGDSDLPLHEYLGLTKEQYMLWLRKPELVEKHYR